MAKKYTPAQLRFLSFWYLFMNVRELTQAFNNEYGTSRTESAIHSALGNHKIRCGRKPGQRRVQHKRLLTKEQDSFVREKYKALSIPALTDALNAEFGTSFKPQQLKTYTKNHKILSGRTGCFEKGIKPWNTGTKGVCKPNSGCFKKGDVPANVKPLGHERIDTKNGFIHVKVAEKNPYTRADTRYKHKQVVVWEKHFGPVPEGKVIAFKDGDPLNCEPENLIALSRSELVRLNQFGHRKLPKELRPVAMTMVRLKVKAFEKTKEVSS